MSHCVRSLARSRSARKKRKMCPGTQQPTGARFDSAIWGGYVAFFFATALCGCRPVYVGRGMHLFFFSHSSLFGKWRRHIDFMTQFILMPLGCGSGRGWFGWIAMRLNVRRPRETWNAIQKREEKAFSRKHIWSFISDSWEYFALLLQNQKHFLLFLVWWRDLNF